MTTFSPQRTHHEVCTASTAVLAIDRMPRSLRRTVEDLMVDCLTSPSQLYVPGADPLTAAWCTQWHRSQSAPGTIACRQVLTGSLAELELFDAAVAKLALAHGFIVDLRIVD
ncbi:hypothetical protein [Corynebacterium epidermidicanis]|uniref:Uncharacterized protein n=1 Tax=Corynebacterium epidermidicanis TaxID=1050174 RepID=A0A0G3GVT5_9CORY|nr:hypothetical protein [Corynebacterium epidermidicanis]AKK03613.1 hypothetical protein CEPID_08825 [Corynebacterium epidermidicanis]